MPYDAEPIPATQSAPLIGIIAGGALLAGAVVGGAAALFQSTSPPHSSRPTVDPAATLASTRPATMPARPMIRPATSPADPIRRGWELLAGGDIDGARAAFHPLASGATPHPQALHGYALCLDRAGENRPAVLAAIDRAVAQAPNDPDLVYNAAALHLADSPLTSARLLYGYMSGASRPLNEPMQNLLGMALSKVDASARTNPPWRELQGFYRAYDQRLEAGRSQRRWGSQWLAPAEASAMWERLASAVTAVENATREVNEAVAAVNREGFGVIDAMAGGNDGEIALAKAAQAKARQAESAAKSKLDRALAALRATEQPPFADRAVPILPPFAR